MNKPVIKPDPLYQLLRNEDIKSFNEQRDQLDTSELKSGDEIVTSGGIFGTITNVKDDCFVVRIADNTKIELGKGFVSSKVPAKDGE